MEAVAACQKAIAIDPKYAGAYTNLGLAHLGQKRLPEAVAALQKAIELDPRNAVPYSDLGLVFHAQGKFSEAIASCQKAIELDPGFAAAYHNLGSVLLRDQNRVPEAIIALQKAIKRDPYRAKSYSLLGAAHYYQMNSTEAIAACLKAIELDPKNGMAYSILGSTYQRQNKLSEAIAASKKAIDLDPDDASAYGNLGIVYGAQNMASEAIIALRKAIELDSQPKAENYSNLGLVLRNQKKLPEAIAALEKAIELDPKFATAHYNLSLTLRDQNKLPEAMAACQKAIHHFAKFADAYVQHGNILRDQKMLPEAIVAYQKAIEFDPKCINAYQNLGSSLYDQGKLPDAIAAYQKCIDIAPNYAQAWSAIGMVWLRQGSFAEAATASQRALDLSPPGHPIRAILETQLKESRNCLALEKRLPSALQGMAVGTEESLELARLCQQYKSRHATAVLFYQQAFKAQPALLKDETRQLRYAAARSAAMTGTGKSADAGKIGEFEKAKMRQTALAWLRDELDLESWKVKNGKTETAFLAEERLILWQTSDELAAVRDAKSIATLPELEQVAWCNLWSNVDLVLKHVRARIIETNFKGILSEKQPEESHAIKIGAGNTYVIDLKSSHFDAFLRLVDGNGKLLAENDDVVPNVDQNSRIVFTAPKDGSFRIIATSFQQKGIGNYSLHIREFNTTERSSSIAPWLSLAIGQTNGQVGLAAVGQDKKLHRLTNVPPGSANLTLLRIDDKSYHFGPAQPGQAFAFDDQLTVKDPKDRIRKDSPHKVHTYKMTAGLTYTIDLVSQDFDSYLRLEDSTGKQLAEDDDSGGFPHARIRVSAEADGGVSAHCHHVRPGQDRQVHADGASQSRSERGAVSDVYGKEKPGWLFLGRLDAPEGSGYADRPPGGREAGAAGHLPNQLLHREHG